MSVSATSCVRSSRTSFGSPEKISGALSRITLSHLYKQIGWLILLLTTLPVVATAQDEDPDDVIAPAVPLQVQVGKVFYEG